jgi:WD40 repeat protein
MLILQRIISFYLLGSLGFFVTPEIAQIPAIRPTIRNKDSVNILDNFLSGRKNLITKKQNKPQNPEAASEILKGSGHQYDIESLVFSRDGQTLISSSLYNKIHVWNMKTKQLTRTIDTGKNGATTLVISPDGKNIYTGNLTDSGVIQVWNIKTGKLIRRLNSHKTGITALKLTADGKILIAAAKDTTIKLWNTQTGKLIRTLTGHNAGVSAIAISPNGQIIATSAGLQGDRKDTKIRLWNIQTGKLLKTLTNNLETAGFLVFSPDSKNLISAKGKSQDYGKTNIWNLSTGKITAVIPKAAIFITCSPDGKRVLSVDGLYGIDIWDTATGKNIRQITEPVKFDDDRTYGRIYANTAAISPDYQTLAIGDGGVLSGFRIDIRQLNF